MISIGKIDGNADDVMNSLKNYGIPPYLHYVGSRYDRSWVRVLIAQQPVRLEMVLTQPVRKGVITSDPTPLVEGNKMTWELQPGQLLTFYDS